MYLVLSAFTSSPISLVVTTRASAFSFTVCMLPPSIFRLLGQNIVLGSELLNNTTNEISPKTLTEWYMLARNKLKPVKYKLENYNVSVWQQISQIVLNEDFIEEFQHFVDWRLISMKQTLSEDIIREYHDRVSWIWISADQKLSENFIIEFQDKIHWTWLCIKQNLSEHLMRQFSNKINWEAVSQYQTPSEDFIRDFQDKVNWENIFFVTKTFLKVF